MLIICQIDWREVGVAFEMQCFRNCTLSSLHFISGRFDTQNTALVTALICELLPYQSVLKEIVRNHVFIMCHKMVHRRVVALIHAV